MIEMGYLSFIVLYYFAFNMGMFILLTILGYWIASYDKSNDTDIRKKIKILDSDEDSYFVVKVVDFIMTVARWIFFAPVSIVMHYLVEGEKILVSIEDDEDEIKGVE